MPNHRSRRRWVRSRPLAGLLSVPTIALLTFGATAAAASSQPTIASSASLRAAVTARAAAEHTLAADVRALKTCAQHRHSGNCKTVRQSVKLARQRLARLDRSIAVASRYAGRQSGTSNRSGSTSTPTGSKTGSRSKSVTTTGSGSTSSGSSAGTGSTSESTSGSSSSGTGSPTETTISTTPTEVAVPEAPASSTSALQTGINSGGEAADFTTVSKLGAKLVRVGFNISDTAAQLRPTIEKYAAEGVRVLPLAEFTGTMPTPTETKALDSWADAYGPDGTFWTGRSDGGLAIQAIEFGNETDYSEQYHDEPGDASYRERAEVYAVRVKEAAEAIKSSGSTVGLLVQDDDTSGDWASGMYAAVPELTKYVAGWAMHAYGGKEYNEYRYRTLMEQAAAHGASSVPIDVTEWGVSSDNGRCLEYNDGLNPCMTYKEAAEEVHATLAWTKAMLGKKLGMFIFYQTGDQAPSGVTTNWQDYFGVLQHEGQAKGAYTEAVEEVLHS
jgi:hypothetical protein